MALFKRKNAIKWQIFNRKSEEKSTKKWHISIFFFEKYQKMALIDIE